MKCFRLFLIVFVSQSLATNFGFSQTASHDGMTTFQSDYQFITKHTEIVLLENEGAAVAVAPAYQGRVMTSTVDLQNEPSFGWISRKVIEAWLLTDEQRKGKLEEHIYIFGGEERFWLGPEGGQFALFFKPGTKFEFSDWATPAAIDTEQFELVKQTQSSATFKSDCELINYSGTVFKMGIERTVSLLDRVTVTKSLGGVLLPADVKVVGYETNNRLTNRGDKAWKTETGLPSIWLLGMYNPSPNTTIVIPFKPGDDNQTDAHRSISRQDFRRFAGAIKLLTSSATSSFETRENAMKFFFQSMLVIALNFGTGSPARADDVINIESLLQEMTDRDSTARFPQNEFRLRQASSYNRAFKTPDDPKGWFDNFDRSTADKHRNYVRTEVNDGRKEYVVMDHNAAGVITRFWVPWRNQLMPGTDITIRFYLDAAEEPTIEGNMYDLFQGKGLVLYPLAHESLRSAVSFFPIPYAKSCKVTMSDHPFFFQFTYREYAEGTDVKTFTMQDFELARPRLEETCSLLTNARNGSRQDFWANDSGGASRQDLRRDALEVSTTPATANISTTSTTLDRPNIVLLISDDDDYEHFGFMGDPVARTPTLDALAKSGTLFTTAHCPAPLCRPSLASLLSGWLPHQHEIYANYLDTKGIGNDKTKLDPSGSLANRLKDAGYATYATSKYWEGDPRAMGFTHGTVNITYKGFKQFVRKDQDELNRFIDQQGKDKPLFIWWAPLLPHKPHNPPKKYFAQYANTEIPVPSFYEGDRRAYVDALRKFYAMGTWFDDGVSDLIEKLKAAGEYDNTIFLFYVDNGYAFGVPAKNAPTEKGLRTPMFVSWPGKSNRIPSRRIDDPSYALDLHATALDYAGIEPPKGIASRSLRPQIEGRDNSAHEVIHGAVYAHAPVNYQRDSATKRSPERDVYALYARTKRWKYVLYTQDTRDVAKKNTERYIWMVHELCDPIVRNAGDQDFFDLDSDPQEQNNLAEKSKHADQLAKLRQQTLDWWKRTGGKPLAISTEAFLQ